MKNCCLRPLLRNASASHASRRAKKYVFLSAALSLALIAGTFYSLDSGNVQVASMREMLMKAPTEEQLDGARINPLYIDDNAVSGVFNPVYKDVYVYAYVNGSFKAFKRVKTGNVFVVDLPERLTKDDSVHVEVSAFNSNYRFSSSTVTVTVRPDDIEAPVKDFYVGPFKLGKELKAGDQQISATFDVKSSNVFVSIYVDGKYAGGRQFKKSNGFKVNLRNPLKVGEKVEIKMYSYTTKSVLEGSAIVGK